MTASAVRSGCQAPVALSAAPATAAPRTRPPPSHRPRSRSCLPGVGDYGAALRFAFRPCDCAAATDAPASSHSASTLALSSSSWRRRRRLGVHRCPPRKLGGHHRPCPRASVQGGGPAAYAQAAGRATLDGLRACCLMAGLLSRLPTMRHQLFDPACRMRRRSSVPDVRVRVVSVELGRLHQAHHHRGALPAARCP